MIPFKKRLRTKSPMMRRAIEIEGIFPQFIYAVTTCHKTLKLILHRTASIFLLMFLAKEAAFRKSSAEG